MNAAEVDARVNALLDRPYYDPEAAHSDEDELYRDVLTEIAAGRLTGYDAQVCAARALRSQELDFPRWCA